MSEKKERPPLIKLVRNFLIELVLYGTLVVLYFVLALRFLGDFLTRIFNENLTLYAILALALIIAQGVLLDAVTSFLLDQIKLERLE
jgi:hypothetical protein